MGRPFVSAIVLNYNGAHLLPDCLRTLKEQDWPAMEIIVADNGSLDDSRSVAASYAVRWLPMSGNLGFSRANNRAAAEAKGEQLFFVNNDMKFKPDCVRQLVEALRADDSLFAVDPTQLDWEGAKLIHGRTRLVRGNFQSVIVPPFAVEYTAAAEGPVEVPWGCAGSLLVRRDRFEALGGFDSTFFIDFEDTDVCWRAWRRGWRTLYVPQAVLHHKVGMSGDQHQHLINTASRQPLPPLWFRRRLSYHTNLICFALKCLPVTTAVRLLGNLMVRAVWQVGNRNYKIAWAMVLAMATNVWRLPSIRAARHAVQRDQALSHDDLMRRFAPAGKGAAR